MIVDLLISYMGVSKNMGKPPNHPFVHRVSIINHPFWGVSPPIFGSTPIFQST